MLPFSPLSHTFNNLKFYAGRFLRKNFVTPPPVISKWSVPKGLAHVGEQFPLSDLGGKRQLRTNIAL